MLLLLVLLTFSGFTVWVGIDSGAIGFWERVFDNSATIQVLCDLSIAMVLFMIWMVRDSRESAGPPWPVYVVAIVLLGSIGALSYLLHRELKLTRGAPPEPAK